MLVEERKARLLAILAETGHVVARSASDAMGVSEDTIRRDLRELARDGKLKRVHGGAMPLSPATAPFDGRLKLQDAEKAAIGRAAANLVEAGQLIFLDGGTTALNVARSLPETLAATVMTHSPNVALELMRCPRIDIEIVGGRLFRHSIVTTGAATMSWLSRFRPDIAFIGATGLHPDHGVTTGDSEEAEVKRKVIDLSGSTYVLASSEKIGAVSSFVIGALGDVDGIITGAEADRAMLEAIAAAGPALIEAG
ncbi:DeoR/GlpR family DNA-binding transcription regulator [Martelella radicis]|uniref:DeoR/GlpR family transcriptional regulator of sugar metabolism n=1 Tax=Martelella radicis TaxID=1397476 RepID=A0A7W6KMJ4_9HYPH|nr:DeoR/GlpR family DNA-binding transcription regulator [Martelella radicis]MBB4124064.1 DeoR/GlpR family transcriptional regulator of sugar metabolism [Martelella radicis]